MLELEIVVGSTTPAIYLHFAAFVFRIGYLTDKETLILFVTFDL